jgi:formylglycine-generating enzyme required for sulfatase activity
MRRWFLSYNSQDLALMQSFGGRSATRTPGRKFSYHANYDGAPAGGSAWKAGDGRAVVRGGSWDGNPRSLRASSRSGVTSGFRYYYLGFRVARTLIP